MKFLFAILALCLSLAFVAGQQYFLGQRRFAYNTLDLAQPSARQVRDPRQNRGPVVFPPSPPDAIEESSGVVVGASGFGFVPPQQRLEQAYYATTSPGETFGSPATSFTSFNYYSNPFYSRFRYF